LLLRALARTGRSSFWAMADQAVVSVGNFGIMAVLAKEFARRGAMGEFGSFGMLFELMWLLNAMHGALVAYPLSVKGAVADLAGMARLAGAAVVVTLLLGPLIGGSTFVMAAAISTPSVALWAAIAAVVWQVQETTRRALLAELRFGAALWGDGIRYVGHVAFAWVLAARGELSLEGVFQTMVASAALGAALQMLQLRLRVPGPRVVADFARAAWEMGRWILAGNAASACIMPLSTINFRYWQGAEAVGIAFALNNLLRLTNPLMFTMASLITPHAARARATGGVGAAKRVLLKFGGFGALLLAPYLAVLVLFPHWCIRLATNPEYQQYWWVLVMSAVSQGLIYVGGVTGTFLNAVERNRQAFVGQAVYAVAFLVVGIPATALLPGIVGPALGVFVASALLVVINCGLIYSIRPAEELTRPTSCAAERPLVVSEEHRAFRRSRAEHSSLA
jgi:O-antigen/teichoic acid export membrane protein